MGKNVCIAGCLLACLAVLLLPVVSSAQRIEITSPASGSLFQHVDWTADISVTAFAPGVPLGGAVVFVLDWGMPLELVLPASFSSGRYTGVFRDVLLGEHTLDALIVDAEGVPIAQDRRTRVGVGDFIITLGDSITLGEVDDIYDDNWSADGRNGPRNPGTVDEWGGFQPILNDLLTNALGYPHSVVNLGISGEKAGGAVNRLNDVLAQYPTARKWLVSYGTNDTNSGVSPGTFKSHITSIVSRIRSAIPEASIYLSKIFYFEQTDPDKWRIPRYQDGMADIIRSTPGVYWGADLDTLFRSNDLMFPGHEQGVPGTWLAVNRTHHPNGIGIQKMAMLWKMLLVDKALLVTDGVVTSFGSTYGDRIGIEGAGSIGLSQDNLLMVCEAHSVPSPGIVIVDDRAFRLALTGATSFSGGYLDVTVRADEFTRLPVGVDWDDIRLMKDSVFLPTTRWQDSSGYWNYRAQVDGPGLLTLGLRAPTGPYPNTGLKIRPVFPDGRNNWYVTMPVITLSSNSKRAVPTYYRWDGGAISTYSAPMAAPLGKHTLAYWSGSGDNREPENHFTLRVDTTPPTTPIVAEGLTTVRRGVPVTISWVSLDPESGIDKYWHAVSTIRGAGDIYGWRDTIASSVTFTPTEPVGTIYYFSIKVRNRAGLYGEIGESAPVLVVE